MEAEKGKTAKYLKQKQPPDKEVIEQLKSYTKKKKQILNALKEGEKTIPELSVMLSIPADEVLFQLMSLLKYGEVECGDMDDMDEYFYYKLSKR